MIAALLAGCATDPAPGDGVSTAPPQAIYSDVAGVGPLNGIEWQVDAPWRLEPGATGYDKLPLITSFHDARVEVGSPPVGPRVSLARLCAIYVVEDQEVTTFLPSDLYEIEASKRWLVSGDLSGGANGHQLRRLWNGDSADGMTRIADWAEWHATAMYQLHQTTPGADVGLAVMARVSRTGSCLPNLPMDHLQALWQAESGRESNGGFYPESSTPHHAGPLHEDANEYYFTDFLKVHVAAQPLPKFDQRWVYGDLHYHSQGTDNEGESAINYRGVVQAMKAMGMDYVFATEHASNSHQISSLHMIFLKSIPYLEDLSHAASDYVVQWLEDQGYGVPIIDNETLRDMSPQRFAHLHGWLNALTGVNAQVAASGGSSRRPQIFLGGEVDVIPEISAAEAQLGAFTYAGDRSYAWSQICTQLPPEIVDHFDLTRWEVCPGRLLYDGDPDGNGTFALKDVQGLGELEGSRQHVVYLPYDSGAPGAVTGPNAFIPSNTGKWGGATRYLGKMLKQELERDQKGYVFLAHPVDAASGSDAGRAGPDIVPYSDTQLATAFKSPYVLGLEFWNEDSKQESLTTGHQFPMLYGLGEPDWEVPRTLASDPSFDWGWQRPNYTEVPVMLHRGARMWDQMLRWGITPSRTAGLTWIGNGPRKVFMSGGSDAHGDLNYRRTGRFLGLAGANDTAIGKPRNLTFVASAAAGAPLDQNRVVEGLRDGRFSVTDGPALRIAVDVNGNGVIDDADVPMGGDFAVAADHAPVLVEWKSTPEFGAVERIDLYVGVQGGASEGIVYAPSGHGTTGSGTCIGNSTLTDVTGRVVCPMTDGYVRDPGSALRFEVPIAAGLGGTRAIDLRPSAYPVFETSCASGACRVFGMQAPARLYVRAFARTRVALTTPIVRQAYTNPVWMTAPQAASPPEIAIGAASCNLATSSNTFALSLGQGVVPGTLTSEVRVGDTGPWVPAGTSVTAPSGATVFLRARACNAVGCSGDATTFRYGPTCVPPTPAVPSATVEYVRCNKGTNIFTASAVATGAVPVTSMTLESKAGSGNWVPVAANGSISAASQQTVSVRAKACNLTSCSDYGAASATGPRCSTSGGGGGGF